jgi:hypothetical protein
MHTQSNPQTNNEIARQIALFLPKLDKLINVLKSNINREYPEQYPLQYLKKQEDRKDVGNNDKL